MPHRIFTLLEKDFTTMARTFQSLLFMLAGCSDDRLIRQNELLKAENDMLRKRVPKKKIHVTTEERERLLKLGLAIGPSIRHLLTIVSYSTFRRWVRNEQGDSAAKRKGRPRLPGIIRELVLMIAKQTGWGYGRILGEIRKLKIGPISKGTVKNILIENGLDPGPKRGKGTWSDFLEIHAETLWQCDFFSKRVWTLRGPRQIFALAFIHLGTRRVFVSPSTFRPGAVWMERQAEAFLAHSETEKLDCKIVMRDLDGKFSKRFDKVFKDRTIQVKKVGPRAPNLNAFVERWVQSVKHEALNQFIVFGQEHFDHIVREYVRYYHDCRPHQGIGNVLLPKPGEDPPDDERVSLPLSLSEIKCEQRLGGLLRHYYRDAA
jgi:putative transposase